MSEVCEDTVCCMSKHEWTYFIAMVLFQNLIADTMAYADGGNESESEYSEEWEQIRNVRHLISDWDLTFIYTGLLLSRQVNGCIDRCLRRDTHYLYI